MAPSHMPSSPASLTPFCCLTHRLHCPLCWNLLPCDPSPPLPQADGDRRTHPTLGPRGPVLGSPHAPLFLPPGLESEAGGTMPSRLQPILLLDPSVSHPPLLTGESCCFPRGGAGSLHPGKGRPPPLPHLSVHLPAGSCPPPVPLLLSILPHGSPLMPPPTFFPVPGFGPLPFHFAQSLLTTERLSGSGLHWPLSRTRSEPLPPSATAPPSLGPLQPRLERLSPHVQLIKVRGTGEGRWKGLLHWAHGG